MSSIKRKKVEQWLKEYKEILTILALERALGFKRGIISKFLTNKRRLTRQEIKTIDQYIHSVIAKYLDDE